MSSKFKILAIVAIILVGVIMFWLVEMRSSQEVKITTQKTEYSIGDSLKVEVKNNLNGSICFSSCYPYYLEKKNGEWEKYQYSECPGKDLSQNCIESQESKIFELTLSGKSGIHRISVPVCLDCREGKDFAPEKVFYSNEFEVK